MSMPDSSGDGAAALTEAACQSDAASTEPLAALVPVVYSGSPAMAIRLHDESLDARTAAARIVTELQSLGCEVLRLDDSNRSDLHAPGVPLHQLAHLIYNKSYDGDEMARALGAEAGAVGGGAFHAGFDLQALMDVGPAVWRHCDAAACLGIGAAPDAITLRLFVDMAELREETLERYRSAAIWNCSRCSSANDQRCGTCSAPRVAPATAALPPPPPPLPPSIPAPPSPPPPDAAIAADAPVTFSVTSFNILSADYAHPTTFSYCDPAHLAFSYREPRILSALASASGDSGSGSSSTGGSEIECMQEVDFDAVARGMFDSPAHGSVFVRRPNHKRDGCLIRWREDAFQLMPIPLLVPFEPHNHRHRGAPGAASGAAKRDQTQARVRSADPRANLDRLGERVKKWGRPSRSATAAGTDNNNNDNGSPNAIANGTGAASASPVEPTTAPAAQAQAQAQAPAQTQAQQQAKQRLNLSKRQTHILKRMDLLDERLEALREAVAAATQTRASSHAGSPAGSPSTSASVSSSACLSPPAGASVGVAGRSRSRSPSCTRGRCASKSPLGVGRAPPHQYFHPMQLNDLSLLTRSKRNCHSSLYARYKKENVGVAILLRSRVRKDQWVLVLNAHLYWSPECEDVKLHQATLLLQQVSELRRMVLSDLEAGSTVSIVCAGDFNSTPNSDVYALVTRGCVPLVRPFVGPNGQAIVGANAGGVVAPPPTSPSPVPIVSSPFHDIVFAHEPAQAQAHTASPSSAPTAAAGVAETAPDAPKQNGVAAAILRPIPVDAVSASLTNGAATAVATAASSSAPMVVEPAPASSSSSSSSPNVRIRLLLDSTLLRITKWLRAIGVDTICQSSTAGPTPAQVQALDLDPLQAAQVQAAPLNPVEQFFALARSEGRVVVSQNRSLLRRRGLPPSAYAVPPSSKDPLLIFSDLCDHFGFRWDEDAFYSRCTTCNALVRRLSIEEYESLPFLPAEYRLGVDDDGAPLHLTKCSGSSCGRVRWWSSRAQLRTRQKLFQARLDMDVSDEERWGGEVDDFFAHEDEEEERPRRRANGVHHPEADESFSTSSNGKVNGSDSKNGAPSRASNSNPPAVAAAAAAAAPGTSSGDMDVVALRAARKASKMALKASRAAAAATRKQLNQSRVHFALTADVNALRGDDGDYLFDERRSMADSQAAIASAHADADANGAPVSAASATQSQSQVAPVPRELHSQIKAALMDPKSLAELWWTADKKAKMIQVERRIIMETKRTLQKRKSMRAERQASAEAATATEAAAAGATASQAVPSTESADSDALDGSELADSGAASAVATVAPSFAARLHAYWQHVSDLRPICDCVAPPLLHGQPPPQSQSHSHSLDLASAYSSFQGREPPFTNCTPKFIDCIDYLFHSRQSLRVVSVRQQIDREQLQRDGVVGFPTPTWPSDHCLLRATFQFQ